MVLTPEEELRFYGFSEEHAQKMLLEAELDAEEDDVYMLALSQVEAIKEDRKFGWLGNSLQKPKLTGLTSHYPRDIQGASRGSG